MATDHDTQASRGALRDMFRHLNWVLSPFQRLDVVAVYDLLATRTATARGLYLNLGYWREARDLDSASEALAMLVGETARLGPTDTLLDVGYGFGDQDILWARRLGPARIIGLNVTASQVAVARRRVADAGLADRIDLREGSATAMPLPDASVDVVVALECAFHFQTRERFFQEAFRVLRPGGRVVTADIIPMPRASVRLTRLQQQFSWWLVASKFAIPQENAYTSPTYHAMLAMRGFEEIRMTSIRSDVYAPLHDALRRDPAPLRRLHPVVRLAGWLALRFSAASVYRGLDYILASARKPG